jgi:putative glutamine amidotransferase
MIIQASSRPRVGVPWRTVAEETANRRAKIEPYLRAVELAGGDAVVISLTTPADELRLQAEKLDGFVLTGSPADLDPAHFRAKRHPATADADPARERADFALLEHALEKHKPVLAICYGLQSLNVFLGGSLIQDIPSEIGLKIRHSPGNDEPPGGAAKPDDPVHGARFDVGRVLDLFGEPQAEVNSSHHQSVLAPGRGLRIAAHAPDGVVEAVEWIGDSNWIVGVQWHPERRPGDALTRALFGGLLSAARLAQAAR